MNVLGFDEFINEGLLMSYPIDKVVRYIQNKFNLTNDDIDIHTDDKGEYIILDDSIKNDERYDEIEKSLTFGGYYFSNIDGNVLWFEKKFDKEVFDELKSSNSVKYIYHVSPSINDEKILSQGLIPKSKNYRYDYPDRIYFFSDKNVIGDKDFLKNMCYTLYDTMKKELLKKVLKDKKSRLKLGLLKGEYSVYRIEINKLENIKLYVDPNAGNFEAYYTMDNIKPEWIEKIEEIKL